MKTNHLTVMALLAATVLGVSSCKEKNEVPQPIVVNPDPAQPQDPNKPDTPPVTIAPKIQKAMYSDRDFQQFEYDAQGRIAKYVSQWQSVQSDPSKITRIDNVFVYDAAGQLTSVRNQAGESRYQYQNGKISTIETYATNTKLLSTMRIKWNDKNQVTEREEVIPVSLRSPDGPEATKWLYSYDLKGNCVKMEYFYQKNGQYQLFETTVFSEFDNAPNALDVVAFSPFLPSTVFQVNNPGRMTVTFALNPSYQQSVTHQYRYNDKGIVTERNTTRQGNGTITTRFEY
jgi:YD repeat-containing protein